MFRDMRRKNQQLSRAESEAILEQGTSGVLSLLGDGGYPYGVPMSYVYRAGSLYFHSAVEGHKLDGMKGCDKASFCVIAQDKVVPETFTTHYRSVVVFGRVRVLEGEEAAAAMRLLADKYAPGLQEAREREMASSAGRYVMLELKAEHLTGKECIELTRKRGEGGEAHEV